MSAAPATISSDMIAAYERAVEVFGSKDAMETYMKSLKPKKTLSAEHLAKLKAGREKAAAAKKAAAEGAAPAPAPAAPATPVKAAAPAAEPVAPGAPVKAAAAAPAERKDIFAYLFKLQKAGVVNMLQSDSFLMRHFKMSKNEASGYMMEYVGNYEQLYEQYGPHPKSD